MCRLAAYLGPSLALDTLLGEGDNSLVTQSWAAKELRGTTLNADGFGFGWYQDERPAIYTSTLPIWSDANLADLSRTLAFPLWLAYVRSATPGQAVNQANTQPFRDGHYLFLHNGRIEDFNAGPRTRLHACLDPAIASGIEGNSDSEYLFALLRQQLTTGLAAQDALLAACRELESVLAGTPALLNMVLSDGKSLFALRHAVNGGECPTLYYTREHPAFSDAVVIASEPFSQAGQWQACPEHSLLRVNSKREIEVSAL